MHQLRWNALLRQWVAVTTARQNRPQMPANWCPFDPGSGRVPEHYDVCLYPNDFPAFSPDQPPFVAGEGLFQTSGARGACDVVLYSPEHTLPPSQLTEESWRKVIELWTARTLEHQANPDIATVAIFENCGEAVGVTMPHPHGQIYALPFLPPVTETELSSMQAYAATNDGSCLLCRLLAEEAEAGDRVVATSADFVAFVPFAARFPAEIWLVPRHHVKTLVDLTSDHRTQLAKLLSIIRKKYDNLYGFLLPLMMAVKQAPLKETNVPFHFHLQFMPLQRSATKLKYLATIETGFGTFLADTAPEEMAKTLRETPPVSQ